MPISPLNRVLLLLISAVFLVLVGLWTIPVDEGWSNVAAITPVDPGPVAIKAAPAMSATDNLTNRPIFDPTRRAAMAMAPQPAAESPPPPTLVLAGLLVGSGRKVALIRTPDQKDLVVAHEGDTVSSWLIKEITADHVVISSNGASQELRFPERVAPAGGMPGMGTVTAPGVHTY